MTIAPIGAVGTEPAQALKQATSSAGSNQVQSAQTSTPAADTVNIANAFPASIEQPAQVSYDGTKPTFATTVLDGVYSEIDKMAVKMPDAIGPSSPIDAYKQSMASQVDGISPMAEGALKNDGNKAVTALNKTFDHAIFMAMVNQVVSGVSDTARTLIRQS